MAITDRPTDTQSQTDAPRSRRPRREPSEPRRGQPRGDSGESRSDAPNDAAAASPATGAQPADTEAQASAGAADPTAAAFSELHRRRLHAFALLLTLGDRDAAGRLTMDALAAGDAQRAELAHPERAAAWLRHHVFAEVSRRRRGVLGGLLRRRRAPRPAAVPELRASDGLLASLAALPLRDRAALILWDVEGFRELDIADALGCRRSAVEEIVRRARQRYGSAYVTVARANGAYETAELPDAIRDAAGPPLRRPAQRTS